MRGDVRERRGDALGALGDYKSALDLDGAMADVWLCAGTLYIEVLNDVSHKDRFA